MNIQLNIYKLQVLDAQWGKRATRIDNVSDYADYVPANPLCNYWNLTLGQFLSKKRSCVIYLECTRRYSAYCADMAGILVITSSGLCVGHFIPPISKRNIKTIEVSA